MNRADWLFAVMLQQAVDYGSSDLVADVAAILGPAAVAWYAPAFQAYPPAALVVTDTLCIVAIGSTQSIPQWVGNVLGSAAASVPPAHGTVSLYFGSAALSLYTALRSPVLAASASRQVVFIGFSLGGALAEILKDMFVGDGLHSASVAIAAPRPGTLSFADGYDTENAQGFNVLNDPISSLPPATWTGWGGRNAWTPFPPLVTYSHVQAGNHLKLDGTMNDGWDLQTVDQVAFGFDIGVWLKFHNQPLYARLLRSQDFPEQIPDGFQGYPNASKIDPLAARLFAWGGIPWQWAPNPRFFSPGVSMPVQLRLYFQNVGYPALGFQEVYYFASGDPNTILQNAVGAVSPNQSYAGARCQFLSSSMFIYAAATSIVGTPRSGALKKLNSNQFIGQTKVTEKVEPCITYFGYSTGKTAHRQFHFRGIASNWIQRDQLTTAGIDGMNLIYGKSTAFLDIMIKAGLSILGNNNTIGNAFPIAGTSKDAATGNVVLTLAANKGGTSPPAFPLNTILTVTGCRSYPLLNGDWLVTGVSPAGQAILSGSFRYNPPALIPGGAVRVKNLIPFAVATCEFNGVGKKDTGRPSFLQRGRRPARVRHR